MADSVLLADVRTPALVVDEAVLRANIEAMAAATSRLGVGLRPHAKAHKSAEIARLQVAAGAIGITVSTVAEASVMADAGINSILVANQVVDRPTIAMLAALARSVDVMVLVDDPANAGALSAAATQQGCEIGVLVEFDVGMGRCGTRSIHEACSLAEWVVGLDGIRFAGVHGYEGHCSDELDRAVRASECQVAMDRLGGLADALRARGLDCAIVSAGATGTFREVGAHSAVTEIQPGSYVFMDGFHQELADEFAHSLVVVATVLSVHGDLAVLDAGRKALSTELSEPILPPGLVRSFIHEEHLGVKQSQQCLTPGDRITIIPGYAPGTVNLYDHYTVLTNDGGVATWAVCARRGN